MAPALTYVTGVIANKSAAEYSLNDYSRSD
jgi:hypothetical protein